MRTVVAYAISALVHAAALGGLAVIGMGTSGPGYRLAPGQAINARFSPGMTGVTYDQPVRFESILTAAVAPTLEPDDSLITTEMELPLESDKRIEIERQTTVQAEQEPAAVKVELPASELVVETSSPGPRLEARESPPEVEAVQPETAPRMRRTVAAAPQLTGTGADPLPFQLSSQAGSNVVDDGPRHYPTNRKPPYPVELWNARIEGEVILRIKISEQGAVLTVMVERSSGWPAFDDAALLALKSWRFEPARRFGAPVASEWTIPVTFRFRS